MSYHDLEGGAAPRLTAAPLADRANDAALDRAAVPATAAPEPVDRVACRLGDASCAGAHASAIDRAPSLARSAAHGSVLRLQRRFGNRYVGQVLHRAHAGRSGEADLDGVERSIDRARSGGQPLDHRTRSQMESSFGADFSGVRVHTGAEADSLNHQLSARAFATGQDVFFRQGEYNPGSTGGRELLAHELTHVVQQTGGGAIQTKLTVSQPGDAHEQEADRMASAVMKREQESTISRAEDDKEPEAELQRQTDPLAEEEEKKKKLATPG